MKNPDIVIICKIIIRGLRQIADALDKFLRGEPINV